MNKKACTLAVFGIGILLSGCQAQMMSDSRMSSAIAGTLGVPASDVTLSDRTTQGPTNTSVIATLSDGKRFACTVNGGGLLAAGMMNPPTCNPAQ
jgi:hypothetical protein